MNDSNGPRIVVVGPCAAGKSTLVRALRLHGHDAYACAQEHSEIEKLWNHQHPQVMIALSVDLESIRARRRDGQWSRRVYESEVRRLRDAFQHADLVIDTSVNSANEVVALALAYLTESRAMFGPSASDRRSSGQ
jgi:GTPase SAR1 family protein